MHSSIDGFYAAYLTGAVGQGFGMFVFRKGTIVGSDATGVKYDGTYTEHDRGVAVKLAISFPPNTLLVQGVTTGPEGENSELEVELPKDFLSLPFLRIAGKHGPVNAKLVKLRELHE